MSVEGNDPLLSEEETSALLNAMRENERAPEHTATQIVDPEREMRALLGRADASAPSLGLALRAQLLKQIARGVDVVALPSEIVPREVLMSALDPSGLRYRIASGENVLGLMAFDACLVRFIVDRCMGAPESIPSGAGAALPRFSELDRRIFAPLPQATGAALVPLLGGKPSVSLATEEPASASSRFEPLLRMSWKLQTPMGELGQVSIALSAGAFGSKPAGAKTPKREQLGERLAQAELELSAVLGTVHSTVRELLSLDTGDVLRLSTSPEDRVCVCADDVIVARGVPVVRSGNIAIEITERS